MLKPRRVAGATGWWQRLSRARRRAVALFAALTLTLLLTPGFAGGGNAWATENGEGDAVAPSSAATPMVEPDPTLRPASASTEPSSAPDEPVPDPSAAAGEEAVPTAEPAPSILEKTPQLGELNGLAAAPLAAGTCSPGDLYLAVSGRLLKYSAGQITEIKLASGNTAVDALAVTADGYAYFVERDTTSAAKIHRVDLSTGAERVFTGSTPLAATWWAGAAVNPQDGILYYSDAAGRVYAFDTRTDAPIGFVGRLQSVSGSGDIAFDPEGNLYAYWENTGSITMVKAADVPATPQTSTKTLSATSVGRGYSPYSSGLA
ncbi:MAG: hypothetical protein KIT69_00380, partial [Propionibacteriaceae bacterium]|nr:hypothetical protein [Propionibacteriaceae bacterium]